MEHLLAYQESFRKELNIAKQLEDAKPVTAGGLTFVESWSKFLADKGGSAFTIAAANVFVSECAKHANLDIAIDQLRQTVVEQLKANSFKSKIAIVAETFKQSKANAITAPLAEKLNTLLSKDEAGIKESLSNGDLDRFANVYNLHSVIREANANRMPSVDGSVITYSPASFVQETEGGCVVRFGRYMLKLTESGIEPTGVPSDRFNYISSIVEHAKYKPETKEFAFETTFGTYRINQDGINCIEEGKEEPTIIESVNLAKHANTILDARYSGVGNRKLVESQRKVADAIIALKENFDEISSLDNMIVAENSRFDEKIGIIAHGQSNCVITESSKRYPVRFESFKTVQEAIERFKKLTNVDASDHFNERLASESKAFNKNQKFIADQKALVEKLAKKMNKIANETQGMTKGSPAYNKMLEAYDATKELTKKESKKLARMQKG